MVCWVLCGDALIIVGDNPESEIFDCWRTKPCVSTTQLLTAWVGWTWMWKWMTITSKISHDNCISLWIVSRIPPKFPGRSAPGPPYFRFLLRTISKLDPDFRAGGLTHWTVKTKSIASRLIRTGTGGELLRTADISKIHIKTNLQDMSKNSPDSKRSRSSGSQKNNKKILNIFFTSTFWRFLISRVFWN